MLMGYKVKTYKKHAMGSFYRTVYATFLKGYFPLMNLFRNTPFSR
jgi:hypothetical protein